MIARPDCPAVDVDGFSPDVPRPNGIAELLDPETTPATARVPEAMSIDVMKAIYAGDDETAAVLDGG